MIEPVPLHEHPSDQEFLASSARVVNKIRGAIAIEFRRATYLAGPQEVYGTHVERRLRFRPVQEGKASSSQCGRITSQPLSRKGIRYICAWCGQHKSISCSSQGSAMLEPFRNLVHERSMCPIDVLSQIVPLKFVDERHAQCGGRAAGHPRDFGVFWLWRGHGCRVDGIVRVSSLSSKCLEYEAPDTAADTRGLESLAPCTFRLGLIALSMQMSARAICEWLRDLVLLPTYPFATAPAYFTSTTGRNSWHCWRMLGLPIDHQQCFRG